LCVIVWRLFFREEKLKKENEFAKKSVDTKKFRARKDAEEESSEDEQKPVEDTKVQRQ
jgi:hypothetical protein